MYRGSRGNVGSVAADASLADKARAGAVMAILQKEQEAELRSSALVKAGGEAIPAFKVIVYQALDALKQLEDAGPEDPNYPTLLAKVHYLLDAGDAEEEALRKMNREAKDEMRRASLLPAQLNERTSLLETAFRDLAVEGQKIRAAREQLKAGIKKVDHAAKNFKPPVVSIKKFSGEKWEEYISFKESFTKLFEKMTLSDSQRFHYLREHLTRDAANVVARLEIEDASYGLAWGLLDDYYGDATLTKNKLMGELLNLSPCNTKDPEELRKFHSALSIKYHRLLVAEPQLTDQHHVLLPVLEKVFPYQVKRDIFAMNNNANPTTVPMFLDLVDRVIKADLIWRGGLKDKKETNKSSGGRGGPSHSGKSSGGKASGGTMSGMAGTFVSSKSRSGGKKASSMGKKTGAFPKGGGGGGKKKAAPRGNKKPATHTCPLCKGPHALGNKCEEFKKMSPQTRKDKVTAFKLCYNCLSEGHMIGECKSPRGCGHGSGKNVCGSKSHHTLLHLPKKA
jgi:hypothetical protein